MIALETARTYLERQNDFGFDVPIRELINKIDSEVDKKEEITIAGRIKNHKENLTQQDKSPSEILQLLISKFEDEEAVSTWVDNWKSFMKLHQFAKSKPPK